MLIHKSFKSPPLSLNPAEMTMTPSRVISALKLSRAVQGALSVMVSHFAPRSVLM